MGPIPTITGVAALAAAVLVPSLASAQWNNQPYQFRSNIGGGAGMSQAYREAMINEELFDRRPDNLVRGADGRLLEVVEYQNQAFLANPEPDFLPRAGATGARAWVSVGGLGAGLGIGSAPIAGWTAATNLPEPADYGATRLAGSSPIDQWIGQLDHLE